MANRNTSPPAHRPTAKRSPSILVTDARSNNLKGARAPFAGHNFRKQQQSPSQSHNFDQQSHQSALAKRLAFRNRYTDISVDKLLSNSSDIPSGQSRLPPLISSTNRNQNIRSIPQLSSTLPSRTSKKSQRLVLIPDKDNKEAPQKDSLRESGGRDTQTERLRAELMPKEDRAQEFSRMTAYFICDEFNLVEVSKFLKTNHEVKPRMYDEALYVPYSLPLLPGSDGFRVRSNNLARLLPNKKLMELMINRSEQTDHLYEYYSGVETPEDANNYSMDPELETPTPFDPLEPQFFAPPEEMREASPPIAQVKEKVDPSKHHAEMFIFAYGIVVFWNFSETHEKNVLADLAFALGPVPLVVNPISEQDIETEEFHFEYDNQIQRPRIYNDMITLRLGDHLIKLTMSHAIAQLTKLCLFELRMVNILQLILKLPKKLALTGRLGLKRTQLLKKSGKLFKLRVDVNLLSLILDTPDYFWSFEPALQPLYTAVREYLEIDQRVQVLNDRCKVFLEFLDIVSDSINEKNTNRITWMIIVIIFMSLTVSVIEFIMQMI